MASEGPRDVEDSIGFLEGLQLKLSDWMSGKTIRDRLDGAVMEYNFPMIEWCVQQGADLNKPNWGGLSRVTPFYCAIFYYRYYSRENIERLIDLGANVHAEHDAYSRKTLLHDAVVDPDNNPLLDILIEKRVDLDAMECGYTALWLAAQQGLTLVVEKLIQAGADLNRRGTNNVYEIPPHSPLEAAMRAGRVDTVALLRQYGALESHAALETQSSPVASSSSSRAITPSAKIAADRKKPAKHARKDTPVKETASKRARKR
ncbi:MAG: ankyrin repeat domain-containing protein [Gammaproteobacteria bacterium]|jgi:ankyrin repeat protein|nr:ankyrin repeat domain-containing protein [Gammaproteobacteria bacterium]